MNHDEAVELIRRTGVIAIMRAKTSKHLLRAAEAVRAGGVCAIEVTMTTAGALAVVEQAASAFGDDTLFGVGTVLDAESARAAIRAGAQFIVAPSFDLRTVQFCRRHGIPVIPGAYTSTEIVSAWQAGADMVKIFPASAGGPDLIKALKAPLPQIEMVAVGGVELSNAAHFVRSGAVAVGVGSALIDQKVLDAEDFSALTERARRFVAEVVSGRSS